ncbi:MAG TPA: radical SAM protein [Blastocatellia bacterium]|nr:radical SAM protein [Blastocatellia bacterium]
MKVTLIRPSMTGHRAHDAMEPLAFAILAGRTPNEVELELFDERLEEIPDDHETDLVALTVETYTARRAYQIANRFRSRGIPVVMGGYHVTFLPDEALQFADSVVMNDAEDVWERVVRDAQSKRLQRVYRRPSLPSLAGLRFDRSVFNGKRYTPVAPVQYGRGCKYACDFCSIHAFYGTSLRQRPVAEVVAEIESLNRRFILLVDDNLFVEPGRAEELFRALIPLKIKWGCQVSIDVADDLRLLKLMERSGCIAALVGFESLDQGNLVQMNKKWNLRERNDGYASAIRRFQDHGIMIYGSFIFGYDHDTTDVFARTVDFAIGAKLFLVNFSALTPTPGTRLYLRLRAEGRLIHQRWWLDPDYRYGQATYHPKLMTADELTEGALFARRQFYSASSILRRATDFSTNCRSLSRLGIYALANLMSKRELSQKLGHRLGDEAPLEIGALPLTRDCEAGDPSAALLQWS